MPYPNSKTKTVRFWLGAALLLCCSLGAQQAQATATYSADILTTLSITDIVGGSPVLSGFTATGDPTLAPPVPPDGFTFTIGAAEATALGAAVMVFPSGSSGHPGSMTIGDGFSQDAHADGFASPPAYSQSDAAFFTLSSLLIDNTAGIDAATVSLTMTYDYTLFVDADEPSVEDALAIVDFISFALDEFGGSTTLFSATDISDFKALDTLLGDSGPLIVSGFTTFDVVVDPGAIIEVITLTHALGTAAVVPEPATIVLLGSGLLGLIAYRRKAA